MAVVVKWKRRLTSRVVTSVFQTGQALSQGVENEATITLNEVVKVAKDSTHIAFGFGWKRGKERGKGHRVQQELRSFIAPAVLPRFVQDLILGLPRLLVR